METDPQTISAYLIYLSQFAPVEEQASHNDLALVIIQSSKISFLILVTFLKSPHCACSRKRPVLPQDVARLIVERSTIMNSLFSKHSCRPESEAVLGAFLSIFSAYIRRMRKTKDGEDLYSWVQATSQPHSSSLIFVTRLGVEFFCLPVVLTFFLFLVRVSRSGVSALDYRRDSHHAHPGRPRDGHPSYHGTAER